MCCTISIIVEMLEFLSRKEHHCSDIKSPWAKLLTYTVRQAHIVHFLAEPHWFIQWERRLLLTYFSALRFLRLAVTFVQNAPGKQVECVMSTVFCFDQFDQRYGGPLVIVVRGKHFSNYTFNRNRLNCQKVTRGRKFLFLYFCDIAW